MCLTTDFAFGSLYGGSSITNGLLSPLTMNLLNSLAINIDMMIPVRYSPNRINAELFGKNAPIMIMYTGSRAEQDISGTMSIVMSLDFRSSIVRVAMIAGILHPNPIIIGINDFPWSPILCIMLSIMNAALAM